jgi:hypothetical protein
MLYHVTVASVHSRDRQVCTEWVRNPESTVKTVWTYTGYREYLYSICIYIITWLISYYFLISYYLLVCICLSYLTNYLLPIN